MINILQLYTVMYIYNSPLGGRICADVITGAEVAGVTTGVEARGAAFAGVAAAVLVGGNSEAFVY